MMSLPIICKGNNNKKIIAVVKKVFTKENYILGNEVIKFENAFAKYSNCKYGIAVNSGTDSIILSLMSLGIKKYDEVIISAHTASATIANIISVGQLLHW